MNKKATLTFCFGVLTVLGISQDQQFTQFYAVPTAINPSFAGASVQSRMSTQYRNQWAAIPGAFQAANFSFDQYLPAFKSGVGLLASYNKAGSGGLRSNSVAFQYAYETRIKRNWFFRPSLQFGYVQSNIDFNKLRFYDQMIREGNPVSIEQGIYQPTSYFDFGAGVLTYGPNFWLGASAYHANNPNASLYPNSTTPLARKMSVHGGWRIRIKGNSLTRLDHYMVLAANYISQQKFDQLDFGMYYEFSPVILGIWYRGLPLKGNGYGLPNHDALAVLLGIQAANYKIGYSYDITVSTLGVGSSAGSHEITLSYQWANKHNEKSNKKRIMPCAKF
jgi:type IX secretion system PorP/SprF family membrane protein